MAAKPAPLVAGDTWRLAWAVSHGGSPLDLTGCAARLHLRDAAGTKVAEASTADGRIVIDVARSQFRLTVPAAAMQLAPGSYRHMLEVTWADGSTIETVDRSILIVLPDVTHD